MSYHLIADDNDLNRMVIKILLEKNDICTEEAENGLEVLEKVETNLDKFSFIWLDINMPKMDGIECAKKLNNLKYSGAIVGITGYADFDSLDSCKKVGMYDALPKPITEEILMNIIDKWENKHNISKTHTNNQS